MNYCRTISYAVFLSLCCNNIGFAAPILWSTAVGGNGHYYDLIHDENAFLEWEDAKIAAESLVFLGVNGHLTTITSQAENDFLENNLPIYADWLGAFQPPGSPEPAGGWTWVTGETWDYTNWAINEPNNQAGGQEQFLLFRADGQAGIWKWNDGFDGARGYYVEYDTPPDSPIPEPSTIALLLTGCIGIVGYRWRQRRQLAA